MSTLGFHYVVSSITIGYNVKILFDPFSSLFKIFLHFLPIIHAVLNKIYLYLPFFYFRRVLQETNTQELPSPTKQRAASTTSINGPVKRIDRRRASIATISQQPPDNRRITRRTSDLSLRATAFQRSARPSRLE